MDHRLRLPLLIDIPLKLLAMIDRFNDFRIFLTEGGRGGAKSHSIARFLLYLASKYSIRIACARETQNSIAESVHQLLSELIRQYQLDFDVHQKTIVHRKTGAEFIFIGLREQGRYNIKSLEGVDILWIEEGQVITKLTMDVVLPTIRKENSKIFVSMNRHLNNDPAYLLLKGREDCLHLNISYLENEHCTKELIKEAEICKRQNEKDYRHIWLGEPLEQGEDSLFGLDELTRATNVKHGPQQGYSLRVAGFDIARYGDDKCAAVILQQMGALHWEEVYAEEWEKRDINYTTGKILSIVNEQRVDYANIDADGMGVGPHDSLKYGRSDDRFREFHNPNIGYQNNKYFVNPRTINAYKLKEMLMNAHICLKHPKLIDELQTIKYTFDHNQRRMLISKEKMRSDGFKSPNMADALFMAVALIGEVKERQETEYQPQRPMYAREESLFKIAGIR